MEYLGRCDLCAPSRAFICLNVSNKSVCMGLGTETEWVVFVEEKEMKMAPWSPFLDSY